MISEYHLYKLLSEIFRKYIVFPPSTIRNVDYLLVREAIIIEVKSSFFGIYSATKQLIDFVLVSKIYDLPLIALTLPPDRPCEAVAPILFFFKTLREYKINGEIWILEIDKENIVRLLIKGQKPIQIDTIYRQSIVEIKFDSKSIKSTLSKLFEKQGIT